MKIVLKKEPTKTLELKGTLFENELRDVCTSIHCSISHSSQDTETTKMSINREMNKDVVYAHSDLSLSDEKEGNPNLHDNIDEL